MNAVEGCFVGVDLGGTGSRAVSVVNGELAIAKDVPSALLGAGGEDERVERLQRLIKDVVPADTDLNAVGIGASGPVDVRTRVIHNSATLPWFSGFPLVDRLERRLAAPVGIDNDAVAAAFGEYSVGAGARSNRMLMVTLGTGVGAAMLIDGRPFRGADGAHPEGGHIPIGGDSEPCYCGLTGCFEQLASRTALQKSLSVALGGVPLGKELIGNAVSEAPKNAAVRRVFFEYAGAVARGLGALHSLYQPHATVIGGSAAVCLPLIIDDLYRGLQRSPEFSVDVELRGATLGDNAGSIGAAMEIARRGSGPTADILEG